MHILERPETNLNPYSKFLFINSYFLLELFVTVTMTWKTIHCNVFEGRQTRRY